MKKSKVVPNKEKKHLSDQSEDHGVVSVSSNSPEKTFEVQVDLPVEMFDNSEPTLVNLYRMQQIVNRELLERLKHQEETQKKIRLIKIPEAFLTSLNPMVTPY